MFKYEFNAADFAPVFDAVKTATRVYRVENAAQSDAEDEYSAGKIALVALDEQRKKTTEKKEAARLEGVKALKEWFASLRAKLEAVTAINWADIEKPEYKAMKAGYIDRPEDLLAVKEANVSSNLIRRTVEEYAVSHGWGENDVFYDVTNEKNIRDFAGVLSNYAACALNDIDQRGTYGGGMLDEWGADIDAALRNAEVK